MDCCAAVWKAVAGVLCDESPEGNVGHNTEADNYVDTKEVVSFCFRAVHESRYVLCEERYSC